jgi:hypothetical protein
MKTAICFSGLVGSTRGKSQELVGDFKKCFEISSALYKEHIIDKNDVDVFVHSWSTGLEKEILETYKPKKHIIEKQIVFDVPDYKILAKTPAVRKQTHYSLWYSRMMANKLKSEYEQENNFKYDCVMLARFDLAWQTDLIFEQYDQNFFWTQRWPKKVLNANGRMLSDVEYWQVFDKGFPMHTQWWGYPYNEHGLLGMWFFSNSKNIDKFVTMYDKLNEYSLPNRCPLDSAGNMSAHQQCLYHLKQLDMIDNLKFCKNWHDDCPSVRRRYFRQR